MIWLFTGYAGSGKTTTAEYFKSKMPSARLTAFAKRVKDEVSVHYNLDRTLLDTQEGKATFLEHEGKTVRDLLIAHSAQHKEETKHPGIWAYYVKEEMFEHPDVEHWILHDWRYIAELETLQAYQSVCTIRIVNPRIQSSTSPSEHELDGFPTDVTIRNDGTLEDLYQQVDTWIKQIYRRQSYS